MSNTLPPPRYKRVVIVGGGFAGINIAKKLRNSPFQVVLIDRNNYHNFQPLMYQVATAGLEVSSIAYPLRKLLGRGSNNHFRMTELLEIQPSHKRIKTLAGFIKYDYLVLAMGTKTNYFGMRDVEEFSMPLKSLEQSLNLRNLILQNFEKAMLTDNPESRQRMLNYVIAGGGPTGVELAGALSELKRKVLPKDYPDFNLAQTNIILADFAPRLLMTFSEEASAKALKYLTDFGVDVRLGVGVKSYNGRVAEFTNGEKIATETLIWAAGVVGEVPDGVPKELIAKGGRLTTDNYCRLKGFDNIFVAGDLANHPTEEYPNGLPGLAPVAIQQGKYIARYIRDIEGKKEVKPFSYLNKGSLATIGRRRAVADLPKNIKFQGVFAWFIWLFVHLMYLVGFRNKLFTLVNWFWNYLTYDRHVRFIINPFRRDEWPSASSNK